MKELIEMETAFLPYDFTKTLEPRMTITTTSSKLTLIDPKALKRKLETSKYNAQGYYELKTYESNHDDPVTTSTTTVTKITAISINNNS
jgi:hypothetical protein